MTARSILVRSLGAAAAIAALAAAGTAAAAPAGPTAAAAPVAAAAADPLLGSFVLGVGYDRSPRTHTITALPDGFAITAQQAYVVAGSGAYGTPFTALDRIGGDQADASGGSCAVAAGTIVVAKLKFLATDAGGVRHYSGVALRAVSAADGAHACALSGLTGPFWMTLSRHGDTADKDGPANMLCWNETSATANSCSSAFVRLAGTWSPATTTAPATTTPATTKPTAGFKVPAGLVPWYARWYKDKMFKADRTAPVIKALASTGVRGKPFTLDYTSKDDRGFAGETYRIYRGAKLLKAWAVQAGERDGRIQRAPATLPASVSGALVFCVGGADMNGNRTGWSCAPLTIS